MPEYRILHEKPHTTEKEEQDVPTQEEVIEKDQKLEDKLKESHSLLQPQRPDEISDNYSNSSGRRAVLTIAQARTNDQSSAINHETLDVIDHEIEVEPWEAVNKAIGLAASLDLKKTEREPDKTLKTKHDEPAHEHAESPPLRIDEVIPTNPAKSEQRLDPEPGGKQAISIEQEIDHELASLVAQCIHVEPVNAIENSLPEPDKQSHDIEQFYERLESVVEKINDEKLHLDSYPHAEPHEPRHDEPDRQKFSCAVPVDIANTIFELGPLEPETIEFLHEKYEYVSRNAIDARTSDEHKNSYEAAEYARDELLPERDSICPERLKRAQMQIELLQDVDQTLRTSPRNQHFVELVIESDPKTACFEVNGCQKLDWDKSEIPPSLEAVLDERLEDLDKNETQSSSAHRNLCSSLRSREIIACFHRDLQHKEKEVDRLDDEEPSPSKFCTIRISESHCSILRHWEARTIEEFDSCDPSIPATPEAIQEIVAKDREYKLWLSRREHAKTQLIEHELPREIWTLDMDQER